MTLAQSEPKLEAIERWVVPYAKNKTSEISKELFDNKSEPHETDETDETTSQVFEKWLNESHDTKWEHILTALRSDNVGLSILADAIEENCLHGECNLLKYVCMYPQIKFV